MKVNNYDEVWDILKEKKERLIIEDKVKAWIKAEYSSVKHVLESVPSISPYTKNEFIHDSIERAYGVMMFATNNLFDDYNEKLGEWWKNEMLPKFEELKNLLINES